MKISIITLFTDMFEGPFRTSIVGRAIKSGLLKIDLVQLREFATDDRRTVDEAPFGGGPGMVLKPGPLVNAVDSIVGDSASEMKPHVILMSAQGLPLTHRRAHQLGSRSRPLIDPSALAMSLARLGRLWATDQEN